MKNKNNKEYGSILQGLAIINKISFSVIVPILIGVYIGRIIDDKVGTEGTFSIVFIVLGAITGFINLLKIVSKDPTKKQ